MVLADGPKTLEPSSRSELSIDDKDGVLTRNIMTHAGRVYVPLTLFIAVGTFMLVYGMSRVNKFLLWFTSST